MEENTNDIFVLYQEVYFNPVTNDFEVNIKFNQKILKYNDKDLMKLVKITKKSLLKHLKKEGE